MMRVILVCDVKDVQVPSGAAKQAGQWAVVEGYLLRVLKMSDVTQWDPLVQIVNWEQRHMLLDIGSEGINVLFVAA
jgi:hypothetical protein